MIELDSIEAFADTMDARTDFVPVGNAIAVVPVAEWIAKRIVKIEENNNDSN